VKAKVASTLSPEYLAAAEGLRFKFDESKFRVDEIDAGIKQEPQNLEGHKPVTPRPPSPVVVDRKGKGVDPLEYGGSVKKVTFESEPVIIASQVAVVPKVVPTVVEKPQLSAPINVTFDTLLKPISEVPDKDKNLSVAEPSPVLRSANSPYVDVTFPKGTLDDFVDVAIGCIYTIHKLRFSHDFIFKTLTEYVSTLPASRRSRPKIDGQTLQKFLLSRFTIICETRMGTFSMLTAGSNKNLPHHFIRLTGTYRPVGYHGLDYSKAPISDDSLYQTIPQGPI